MSSKTASLLSVILIVPLLLLFAVTALFFEMVLLNGASERQGTIAMGFSLICQGAAAIVLGVLAWKSTNLLLTRFGWKPILAVPVTVLVGALVGGIISFLSLVLSIPLAGIR